MNDNGFDIGLCDDWYLLYVDDVDFICNVGCDEWLVFLLLVEQVKVRFFGCQLLIEFVWQVWVDDVYNIQDCSNYVNFDGSLMNDIEYCQVLEVIFEMKVIDGVNKIDLGVFMGIGGIKNCGFQSRVMVFKDV